MILNQKVLLFFRIVREIWILFLFDAFANQKDKMNDFQIFMILIMKMKDGKFFPSYEISKLCIYL